MTNTPELTLYHAQKDRSGAALRLSLSPAVYIAKGETLEGFIELTLARQMGKPSKLEAAPQWDWEKATPIRLDFTALSELMLLLDGQRKALNNGLGLTFDGQNNEKSLLTAYVSGAMATDAGNIRVVVRTDYADKEWTQASIILSRAEVFGLKCAIGGALTYVAFGDPNA